MREPLHFIHFIRFVSKRDIGRIFFLNVDKETIVERVKKRKILEKRSDDDLDTILKRYDIYIETTKPVLDLSLIHI